jgi:hypothetical protein
MRATEATAETPEEAVARTFIEELGRGEWQHPRTAFTARLKEALPEAKLREVWENLEGLAGRYQSAGALKTEAEPPFMKVHVTCVFGEPPLRERRGFSET